MSTRATSQLTWKLSAVWITPKQLWRSARLIREPADEAGYRLPAPHFIGTCSAWAQNSFLMGVVKERPVRVRDLPRCVGVIKVLTAEEESEYFDSYLNYVGDYD